jgi:hypothetical protein
MQKWEYKVFASHLDPAELVVILDESGAAGWELVTLAAVIDELPLAVVEPDRSGEDEDTPRQAFRYIFKRPLV